MKNDVVKYFLFTVNDQSWLEHSKTGIAAINDPAAITSQGQNLAKRQVALCEVTGIQPNDFLLFYFQGKKQIHGLYRATSEAFFDKADLVSGGFINHKFPIRVSFKPYIKFERNLLMDEIWEMKDKGEFCSIQQQRGDAVGRHACLGLLKTDGDTLVRMLYEKNPIYRIMKKSPVYTSSKPLPFEYRAHWDGTMLHYEAVLQSILIEGFIQGKYKEIFGEFDYFIPFLPTGSQKEIDLFLVKHKDNKPVWYAIVEVKTECFDLKEIKSLANYENWITRSLAKNNARMVHTYALTYEYEDEIKNYVSERAKYSDRIIHLIEYRFNSKDKSVDLVEL